MTETAILGLPLVQSAQAQKHVTVNEAFSRLDALTQISLGSAGGASAPALPGEGEIHAVGAGATGSWAGHNGELALFLNGGWLFIAPATGWRAWRQDSGTSAIFDGVDWIEGAGALSANGAGFVHRSIEIDHAVAVGATSVVAAALPANAIVYGITGRVVSTIGGVSSFQIGVTGSVDRYGNGIGTEVGAWARGLTGSPLAYYADTDVVLTATGGGFDGTGVFRVAVHFAELTLPRA